MPEVRIDAGIVMTFKQLSSRSFCGAAAVALVISTFWAAAALAQTPGSGGAGTLTPLSGASHPNLSPGRVFTYLMVMLGPMKLVGPFLKIAAGMDLGTSRRLAMRGFGIACLAGLAAAVFGTSLLKKWEISLPALLLAAGLVLLLVALQSALSQFSHPHGSAAEAPRSPDESLQHLAFSPLAFPNIITPYGTAALILLTAVAATPSRIITILGIFLLVMLLNLAAMCFARSIVKHAAGVLTLLGAVLGVLQVALAVQMLLSAGHILGVL